MRYRQDTLLAATFAPGGNNNEIFAVGGRWSVAVLERRARTVTRPSLYLRSRNQDPQQIVQPGFASFSPDGQWLFIIPPTLASAANAETLLSKAPPPQGAAAAAPAGGHEPCKLQIWRWSMQNRTYESAGEDLEIQRLPGSRINFAWSPESDRVVLINTRGTNEAECAFLEVKGNTFQELDDLSKRTQQDENRGACLCRVPQRHRRSVCGLHRACTAQGKFHSARMISRYSQHFERKRFDSITRWFPTKWRRVRPGQRPTYPDELEQYPNPRSP